jgi:hypothetical protein
MQPSSASEMLTGCYGCVPICPAPGTKKELLLGDALAEYHMNHRCSLSPWYTRTTGELMAPWSQEPSGPLGSTRPARVGGAADAAAHLAAVNRDTCKNSLA